MLRGRRSRISGEGPLSYGNAKMEPFLDFKIRIFVKQMKNSQKLILLYIETERDIIFSWVSHYRGRASILTKGKWGA